MSREFIVENFTLDRIVKAAAGLDPDKLLSFQEHWVGQLSIEEKVEQCLPYLQKAEYITGEVDADVRSKVQRLISALGDRIKLFSDILSYDEYFVANEDLVYNEKAFKKRITKPERAIELLAKYRDHLSQQEDFTASVLEEDFKAWLEANELGYGDIIHALRVATTGKPAGPGMFECLELLGKESCVSRINRALTQVE